MKIIAKDLAAAAAKTPFLVVLGFEGTQPVLPPGVRLSKGHLADFRGEPRQCCLGYPEAGPAERVALIGLGKREKADAEALRRAVAVGVREAERIGCASAVVRIEEVVAKRVGGPEDAGRAAAEAAVMASYRYDGGKSEAKPRKLRRVELRGPGAAFRRASAEGVVLGEANAFTRDLQNAGGNQMRPRHLAAAARSIARKSSRISCKVLDEAQMKRLGMGLLLGVSAGSEEPAKLIHLVYKPKGRPKSRVAFVGKGLTFDAGGISLKPSARMDEMRYDMSGGAAVLGAFHALTEIDVPHEVHGIVPASENLPDGKATKPGDVHTAMDGTTVEILNTDAEGRLILADALAYTVKAVKPNTIVDLATLTGAVIVGLGHEVAAMFASTDRLREDLRVAGEDTAERLWPLPLLEQYQENLKDGPADLRNICTPELGGGSIAGAAFLSSFVGETEWAHLDIAGTAWGQSSREYVGGKGGTGFGARLLVRYLQRRR